MLEVICFLSGFIVMVLEIAGARLFAPYIGASFITWSSLIGIIMLSLSLGYFFGGKIADKKASFFYLFIFFLAAGMWSFFVSNYYDWFFTKCLSELKLNTYVVSIVSSLSLFAIPTFLLGMCSPYIVKLAIIENKIDNECIAATIGKYSAISTLGSILGTFLTGFYLILAFGLHNIFLFLSVSLFCLALLALIRTKILPKNKFLIILGCLYIVAFFLQNNKSIENVKDLLKVVETPYQQLYVAKGTLLTGEKISYIANGKNPKWLMAGIITKKDKTQTMFPYLKSFLKVTNLYNPNQKSALLLGGGGGVFAKYLYNEIALKNQPEKIRIDIVELDGKMIDIGREFFGYEDKIGMRVHIEDARAYLNRNQNSLKESYDSIYVDVFNTEAEVPYYILSKESLFKMKNLLKKDGIVVVNLISSIEGEDALPFEYVYNTLNEVFPNVEVFKVSKKIPNNLVQNIILVCMNDKKIVTQENFDKAGGFKPKYDWNRKIIITDDYSPLQKFYYLKKQ